MRKFIMGEPHGFGNVYYSMMAYLDSISENEEIELYINGDLIDRGYESAEILLDVKKRVEDNKYKIEYLGGNHELLMHKEYRKRKMGKPVTPFNNWYDSGGMITDDMLWELLNYDESKVMEVVDFVGNLKIYHKFDEKINNKPIVLVHAACPKTVKDECPMRIKDNDKIVQACVWTVNGGYIQFTPDCIVRSLPDRIGHLKYFSIVGHTPNAMPTGTEYHLDENYLNIDGGTSRYTQGLFEYNHFPLVEICDGYLKILTFNSNNEIIYGNYFDGNTFIPFSEEEIKEARSHLNKDVKIKKMSINEDGIAGYWD